jgi:hypothetical protein
MSSPKPYYRRARLSPKLEEAWFVGDGTHVDFSNPKVHLEPFDEVDAVATAKTRFDLRAAAVVRAAAGPEDGAFWEQPHGRSKLFEKGVLESSVKGFASVGGTPTTKCLAIIAYPDFFDTWGDALPARTEATVAGLTVSEAILAAKPGWCGTFGPLINSAVDLIVFESEGNYDMAQMHLLPMAYRYYDELTPDAREHLITSLLARGTVHGPGQKDTYTCGPYPEYWSRAGELKLPDPLGLTNISLKRIGETENHILTIMTARYLTNQLLYQRDPKVWFDNRRNGKDEILSVVLGQAGAHVFYHPVAAHKAPSPGSCTFLLLDLLQRILRDDFSEYNAKDYQAETRGALLNLCSYAYDHEVRLAARMVLDYISAHFVVSSNDLRRMLPFRRRNESEHGRNAHDAQGFMTTGLLAWQDGADTMGSTFAILAGNMRAYETRAWSIWDTGGDQVIDALSDYRIPPSIHDLFVNDAHRRFHQRLHRYIRSDDDEVGGNRNCDNMEIFASSPSYLITAGGRPATYAVDPYFAGVPIKGDQQRGVAVTTSFMPTTYGLKAVKADELIQFSSFTDSIIPLIGFYGSWNYGVAPDFACGHQIQLPESWLKGLRDTGNYVSAGNFTFINQGPPAFASGRPGYFLGIYQENGFGLLEAFDTWLHPGAKTFLRPRVMTFEEFQQDVEERNPTLSLKNNVETHYRTWNGNQFDFVIWNDGSRHEAIVGAEVFNLVYADRDPRDAFGNAGNVTDKFLNGTVMNSTGDAVVEITNHDLRQTITLDMSDMLHPKRISERGEVEQAGFDNEVWLDFDWQGPNEGDACQPFSTVAGATAAVADGGVIKIIPGQTRERTTIGGGKRMTLVAPIGGVTIGVR